MSRGWSVRPRCWEFAPESDREWTPMDANGRARQRRPANTERKISLDWAAFGHRPLSESGVSNPGGGWTARPGRWEFAIETNRKWTRMDVNGRAGQRRAANTERKVSLDRVAFGQGPLLEFGVSNPGCGWTAPPGCVVGNVLQKPTADGRGWTRMDARGNNGPDKTLYFGNENTSMIG